MNLHAAIAAVRAESAESCASGPVTRRRVLGSIERSPRRRLHAVVAAVIASMFGASAFAWYARPPQQPAPPPAIVNDSVASATSEPLVVEQRVARTVERAVVVPAVEPAQPRALAIATPPVDDVSPPVVAAPNAQRDAELALYATAHQLHFQERDLVAALDAWNRYLAAAPAGSLAPEARFNRLVVLVRLKHWDDAARELDALGDSTYRADDLARLRTVIEKHAVSSRPPQ